MTSAPAGRRPALLGGAVLVIGVGLAVHRLPGLLGDLLGGALYAVLVYLLLAALRPRARAVLLAAAALAVCTVIELAQLTDGPRAAAAAVPLVRLVLGTTFAATDLLAYAVGALAAAAVDVLVTNRVRDRQSRT